MPKTTSHVEFERCIKSTPGSTTEKSNSSKKLLFGSFSSKVSRHGVKHLCLLVEGSLFSRHTNN